MATKTTAKKSTKQKGLAPITVEFELERETKNTYRFAEVTDSDTPVIGTLYMQKSAFKSGTAPENLTVLVSVS